MLLVVGWFLLSIPVGLVVARMLQRSSSNSMPGWTTNHNVQLQRVSSEHRRAG